MEDSQLGLDQLLLDMPTLVVVEGEESQEGLELVNRAEEVVRMAVVAAEEEEVQVVGKVQEEVVVVRSKLGYTLLLLGLQEDTRRKG